MLFNEPKLLKCICGGIVAVEQVGFSALQRAEIAEIEPVELTLTFLYNGFSALQRAEIAEIVVEVAQVARIRRFSALQRAEIAEMSKDDALRLLKESFSALQRAEIAEIVIPRPRRGAPIRVSVLFNEPKLLKCFFKRGAAGVWCVSVLFNEPKLLKSERAWRLRVRARVSVLFNEPKLLKSTT